MITNHLDFVDADGRQWRVGDDLAYGGSWFMISIDELLNQSWPESLQSTIESLAANAARFSAIQSADIVIYKSQNHYAFLGTHRIEYLQRLRTKLLPFNDGTAPQIAEALEIIDRSIEAHIQDAIYQAKRPLRRKIRVQATSQHDRLFLQIGKRDGFHCHFCSSTIDLQIDHIIPVSKDGSNDLSNLQILCGTCNRKKSNSTVEQSEVA